MVLLAFQFAQNVLWSLTKPKNKLKYFQLGKLVWYVNSAHQFSNLVIRPQMSYSSFTYRVAAAQKRHSAQCYPCHKNHWRAEHIRRNKQFAYLHYKRKNPNNQGSKLHYLYKEKYSINAFLINFTLFSTFCTWLQGDSKEASFLVRGYRWLTWTVREKYLKLLLSSRRY